MNSSGEGLEDPGSIDTVALGSCVKFENVISGGRLRSEIAEGEVAAWDELQRMPRTPSLSCRARRCSAALKTSAASKSQRGVESFTGSATKQKDLGVAQTWYWAPIYPSSLGRPMQRKPLRAASDAGSGARGAGIRTPNRLAFAGKLRVADRERCARARLGCCPVRDSCRAGASRIRVARARTRCATRS